MEFTQNFSFKYHKYIYPEFDSIDKFYDAMDSTKNIKDIKCPSLLISSKTDPISTEEVIPWEEIERN